MALREGGMIIDAWPAAPAVSVAINVSRMARRAAEVLLAMSDAAIDAITPRELWLARWRRSRGSASLLSWSCIPCFG